ncbi:glycosyltransferase [Cytophagaceae bacterium DM2B3-1]|uniref:Glycosyltransferase n=1 Tax=Xanthocytophaga flava TaxID=3048013 RepID=A0ABT7CDC6_9BACT|nr:glycosyltransferase [Xanthocytophaga flavus]MDJ1491711.1 glycosyltransferase [Xanthocytophaga flavus]
MENIKTITIITPSFNQGQFISETIESILKQTGDFYIDYIIIDGGSSDSTMDQVKKYELILKENCVIKEYNGLNFYISSTDSEFNKCKGISYRWKSESDTGQANAINKGFQMAKGDIVAWLNSDDVYVDSLCIEKVFMFFRNTPDAYFIYAKGYRTDKNLKIMHEESYVTQYQVNDLREIDYILQPSAFWKTEILKTVGLLDEHLHYVFDWDYWIRCSEKYQLYFMDEFISFNRIYSSNKSSKGDQKRIEEIVSFLIKHNSFTQRSFEVYIHEHYTSIINSLIYKNDFLQKSIDKLTNNWMIRFYIRLRRKVNSLF